MIRKHKTFMDWMHYIQNIFYHQIEENFKAPEVEEEIDFCRGVEDNRIEYALQYMIADQITSINNLNVT